MLQASSPAPGTMPTMTAARTALLLRLLLAGVFLFSALTKMAGVGLFEIAIVEQGLAATRAQAALPARLVIAFEIFLGTALLLPYALKRLVLPLVIATLSAFTLLQGYQLLAGESIRDCGCFGELLPMSSLAALIKNVILLGLSLALLRLALPQKRHAPALAALAAASLVAVFLWAPIRRHYDGNFAKYTQFEKAGRVDLTSGDKLVAVFNAECEHCQAVAAELRGLAEKSAGFPPVYVLMFAENADAIAAFSQKTNTVYPYHQIAAEEFFDLIGNSPPRVYWLRDGRVHARWDDDFGRNIAAAFNIAHTAP